MADSCNAGNPQALAGVFLFRFHFSGVFFKKKKKKTESRVKGNDADPKEVAVDELLAETRKKKTKKDEEEENKKKKKKKKKVDGREKHVHGVGEREKERERDWKGGERRKAPNTGRMPNRKRTRWGKKSTAQDARWSLELHKTHCRIHRHKDIPHHRLLLAGIPKNNQHVQRRVVSPSLNCSTTVCWPK